MDDCLIVGHPKAVAEAKKQMMAQFDCDEVGDMKEYIGCKVEYNRSACYVKLTQPVLLQSFVDEFDLPKDLSEPVTPAVPGEVLHKGAEKEQVTTADQKIYCSGVGKLLHLMKTSRPDVLNAVRELSRFMSGATQKHMTSMFRVMKYCLGTPKRGLMLKPNCQ